MCCCFKDLKQDIESTSSLHSTTQIKDVKTKVQSYLDRLGTAHGDLVFTEFDDDFLKQHVSKIMVSDTKLSQHEVNICTI